MHSLYFIRIPKNPIFPPIAVNLYTYYKRRLPTPFGYNFSTIYTPIRIYFTYSIYTIIGIYFAHSRHHR